MATDGSIGVSPTLLQLNYEAAGLFRAFRDRPGTAAQSNTARFPSK
jgi:hypothetical protein